MNIMLLGYLSDILFTLKLLGIVTALTCLCGYIIIGCANASNIPIKPKNFLVIGIIGLLMAIFFPSNLKLNYDNYILEENKKLHQKLIDTNKELIDAKILIHEYNLTTKLEKMNK